ncbi:MAG: hypothetical protein ACREXP_01515 [Steroidobacteraceae bacterium]
MAIEESSEFTLAEQAAWWIAELRGDPKPSLEKRDEFIAWIRRSPRHVREILLAALIQDMLDEIGEKVRQDADAVTRQYRS